MSDPKAENVVAESSQQKRVIWPLRALLWLLSFLWKHIISEFLMGIGGAVAIIIAVGLPVGTMFLIAHIVDTYGKWWLLLFIPFVAILKYLCKPMACIMGEDI